MEMKKLNKSHKETIELFKFVCNSLATFVNKQLLALGHYDGEKVEMAMYDDIKHNLKNEE